MYRQMFAVFAIRRNHTCSAVFMYAFPYGSGHHHPESEFTKKYLHAMMLFVGLIDLSVLFGLSVNQTVFPGNLVFLQGVLFKLAIFARCPLSLSRLCNEAQFQVCLYFKHSLYTMRPIYNYAYMLYVAYIYAMRPIYKYAYILYIAYMD